MENNDYPKVQMGMLKRFSVCSSCGLSEVQIDGKVENHAAGCRWRQTIMGIPEEEQISLMESEEMRRLRDMEVRLKVVETELAELKEKFNVLA